MIKNQWSKDAIIRAYERGLDLKAIQEHFHGSGYTTTELLTVLQERYPCVSG